MFNDSAPMIGASHLDSADTNRPAAARRARGICGSILEGRGSMTDAGEFTFRASQLDAPRPPGISAMMRIRNGAEYLRETIESHVAHYDEIVAAYNDCNDDTEAILLELAEQYPDKVRPFHYLPRVVLPYCEEHNRTPTESVHSLANFYNWTMARTRFSTAVKLDDDHLAVCGALGEAVRYIRADIARGIRKLYTFSGINLVRTGEASVAVYDNLPLVGTGDILYFPVSRDITFRQVIDFEKMVVGGPRLQKEYIGLLYFHLKHMKTDFGFGNMTPERRMQALADFQQTLRIVSITELQSDAYYRTLRRGYNRLEYWLRTNAVTQGVVFAMAQRHAPLRISRLKRLRADLAKIDWRRDLYDPLRLEPEPLPEHGATYVRSPRA
jgi:hypothetical protein